LLKDRGYVVTDMSIVRGAKPEEFEEVTLVITPDLYEAEKLDLDDVDDEDDIEMFPTSCDECGTQINRDGKDFFLEPPQVEKPVVLCEMCYSKLLSKTICDLCGENGAHLTMKNKFNGNILHVCYDCYRSVWGKNNGETLFKTTNSSQD